MEASELLTEVEHLARLDDELRAVINRHTGEIAGAGAIGVLITLALDLWHQNVERHRSVKPAGPEPAAEPTQEKPDGSK